MARSTMLADVVPRAAPAAPLSTPAPGQPPPVLLYRLFVSNQTPTPGCQMLCDDDFVIQLEKVSP